MGREGDGQAGSRRGSGLAKAEAAFMPKIPSPQASKESSKQAYCCSRRRYSGSGKPRSRHHRKRPGFKSIVTRLNSSVCYSLCFPSFAFVWFSTFRHRPVREAVSGSLSVDDVQALDRQGT